MSFRVLGLDSAPFRHLYGAADATLARAGIRRVIADATPGFPDRIELRDAVPGETLLLLNFTHQPANTPYRSSHAVFVREWAEQPYDGVDAIPEVLRIRTISLRAFDADGMMTDAELADGSELTAAIERLLSGSTVRYLHAHFAKRGCYAARIERA